MPKFTESIVEDATLTWFRELDYALLHGQEFAPGEAAAERNSFAAAFLPNRLLNSKLAAEALDDNYRKITIPTVPNLTAQKRIFHRMLLDSIAVECRRKDGSIGAEIARLIDFGDFHIISRLQRLASIWEFLTLPAGISAGFIGNSSKTTFWSMATRSAERYVGQSPISEWPHRRTSPAWTTGRANTNGSGPWRKSLLRHSNHGSESSKPLPMQTK